MRFFTSNKLNIYVITYRRGYTPEGIEKPDHWALVIATSETSDDGRVFQIVHGRPFFAFHYRTGATINGSSTIRKCLVIGKVKPGKVDDIAQALKEVPVVNDDASWNCQSWTKNAIAMLEGLGYAKEGLAANIDKELAAVAEREMA